MTYKEYTQAKQKEFSALPIFWAFSDNQFKDALAKRGIDIKDAPQKIYRLGSSGGFYLKSDAEIIREYLAKDRDKELHDLMEGDLEFAQEAFEYEMFNHEYPINWQGDWDVCNCLGDVEYDESYGGEDYLRALGYSDAVIGVYFVARAKVRKAIDW